MSVGYSLSFVPPQLPIWCYWLLAMTAEWFRVFTWRRSGGRHGVGAAARNGECGVKTTTRCRATTVWTRRGSRAPGRTAPQTTPPTIRRNTAAQRRRSHSPPDTDSSTYSTVTTTNPHFVWQCWHETKDIDDSELGYIRGQWLYIILCSKVAAFNYTTFKYDDSKLCYAQGLWLWIRPVQKWWLRSRTATHICATF